MRNTKKAKPYYEVVSLESVIAAMGEAMRTAHLPYIANEQRMTLSIERAWDDFIRYAKNSLKRKERERTEVYYE